MKKSEQKSLVAKIKKNLVAIQATPVCTTAQLADYYGTTPEIIAQNFRRNKEHFIEVKHYFKLEGEALKEFKATLQNEGYLTEKFAPALYFWTERGAIRHAKMLNTDRAWDVFDLLEEFYFDTEKFGWQKARNGSIVATRRLTDAIKNYLVPLAIEQGMNPTKDSFLYSNYNRLINKCIGIKAGSRDLCTGAQLYEIDKMDNITAKLIEKYVAKKLEYHEIYFEIKDYLIEYIKISML